MNNIDKSSTVVPTPEEGKLVFGWMTEENMSPKQVVGRIRGINKMSDTKYISTSIDNLKKILEAELRLINIFIENKKAKGETAGGKTYEDRRKMEEFIEACI